MYIKDWDTFKAIADSRQVSIQWVDINDHYYMKLIDGPFEISYTMKKSNPAGSAQVDFEDNYKESGNITFTDSTGTPKVSNTPFADKKVGDRSLYTRAEGQQSSLSIGTNTIDFTVPWDNCKLDGIEIVNSEALDTVNLEVLDTSSGLITGVPYYKLNQFGYTVNLSKDYYERNSKYDADLVSGMIIRIIYSSISAKTVGINYILHEVK